MQALPISVIMSYSMPATYNILLNAQVLLNNLLPHIVPSSTWTSAEWPPRSVSTSVIQHFGSPCRVVSGLIYVSP